MIFEWNFSVVQKKKKKKKKVLCKHIVMLNEKLRMFLLKRIRRKANDKKNSRIIMLKTPIRESLQLKCDFCNN